jgi:hypothetical protein
MLPNHTTVGLSVTILQQVVCFVEVECYTKLSQGACNKLVTQQILENVVVAPVVRLCGCRLLLQVEVGGFVHTAPQSEQILLAPAATQRNWDPGH